MRPAQETKPSFNKGSHRLRAGCQLLGSRTWTLTVGLNPSQSAYSLTEPRDFLSCLLAACVQSVPGLLHLGLSDLSCPLSHFPPGQGLPLGFLSLHKGMSPHSIVQTTPKSCDFSFSFGETVQKQPWRTKEAGRKGRTYLLQKMRNADGKGKWVSSPVGSPAYRQELGPVCTVPDPL